MTPAGRSAGGGRSAAGRRAPDRVIVGRIATLAGATGFGWVDAIAIGGGRVVAAGAVTDVLPLAGPSTVVWRPGPDRVVLPGIVDAHLHLASAALAADQPDLGACAGRSEVLAAITAADARLGAAGDHHGWLLGHGWSLDQLGGWPDAADLETAAPGRPVALWSHDHHGRWVSAAGLAAAGIDRGTADPAGGRIGRDGAGEPDGMLFEHAATFVDRAIPPPDATRLAAALERYSLTLAQLGVVGAHDPGELTADPTMTRGPAFYRAIAADGRLPLRVVASVREDQLDAALAAGVRTGRGVEPGADRGDDPVRQRIAARYRDGWLKLFADGSLGSRSAALLAPYEPDDPAGAPLGGPTGMLLRTRHQLAGAARRAADAGIAVQIHGIGDAAVRLALDVLAELPAVGAARHRVEHAQLVDPADQARFGTSGVAASMQPCHLIGDALPARVAWGARTAHAFPLAGLARAGACLAFGTDAPVEAPDPWPGIAAAVTRASGGWPDAQPAFHPEQALPLWRALRAASRDVAASAGVTDEGHLGRGAMADLIVVDRSVVDETPRRGGALERCRPAATLIDGAIVWHDGTFDA